MHFPTDRVTRSDLTTREIEAEAVTYVLRAQLGTAGTEASAEYVKSNPPDASLERIRATAQRLSADLAAIPFEAKSDPDQA